MRAIASTLAQAIVHDPDLVLLDEPLAGLDPEGRDQMLRLIGRLRSFGIYTLVSSHVLTDIESTCDWIVIVEGGRIIQNGTLESLTSGETVALEVLDNVETVDGLLRERGRRCARTLSGVWLRGTARGACEPGLSRAQRV